MAKRLILKLLSTATVLESTVILPMLSNHGASCWECPCGSHIWKGPTDQWQCWYTSTYPQNKWRDKAAQHTPLCGGLWYALDKLFTYRTPAYHTPVSSTMECGEIKPWKMGFFKARGTQTVEVEKNMQLHLHRVSMTKSGPWFKSSLSLATVQPPWKES